MSRNLVSKCILGCGLALAVLVPPGSAHAKGFSVLYSFTGSDGAHPTAGLIADGAGNLYSTTFEGGADGYGVVFKLAPNGTETVLHSFADNGSDGYFPEAGLIKDKTGNLFGTTVRGGADNDGVVFKLAPNGTETVLYSFTGGSDGAEPDAGLIMDKKGNLYSTTYEGGSGDCTFNGTTGCGVVFKLAPDGTETVLHSFTGGSDGSVPVAGLIMDKKGNLYGTTSEGGGVRDAGVVFKLAPDGTETVLYSLCSQANCADGANPSAGLIMDSSGDLYSTTTYGGADKAGVVFKLAPDGTETVLYSFNVVNGAYPTAGLIADGAGNLYGTTTSGGSDYYGVVFKLAPDGTETVLRSFETRSSGKYPQAGLIMDKKGNLYSTTTSGDADKDGGVFKLKE